MANHLSIDDFALIVTGKLAAAKAHHLEECEDCKLFAEHYGELDPSEGLAETFAKLDPPRQRGPRSLMAVAGTICALASVTLLAHRFWSAYDSRGEQVAFAKNREGMMFADVRQLQVQNRWLEGELRKLLSTMEGGSNEAPSKEERDALVAEVRKTLQERRALIGSSTAITLAESSGAIQLVSADGSATGAPSNTSELAEQIKGHFASTDQKWPLYQINMRRGASPEVTKAVCEALVRVDNARPRAEDSSVASASLFYAPTF